MDSGLQHGSHSIEGSRFGAWPLFGPRRNEQPREAVDYADQANVHGAEVADTSVAANEDVAQTGSAASDRLEAAGFDLHDDAAAGHPLEVVSLVQPETASSDQDKVWGERKLAGDDDLSSLAQEAERRSRKSATMSRHLDQHRRQLRSAEKERDEVYAKLARIVPVVQESAASLRDAMNGSRREVDQRRIAELFDVNERALAELGSLTTSLSADFLWLKSAWDQYAQSVADTRGLS